MHRIHETSRPRRPPRHGRHRAHRATAAAPADALAQLAGGAVGERDREDLCRRDPVLADGPDEALDENRGLAASGRRGEQQRLGSARDRLLLLVGQGQSHQARSAALPSALAAADRGELAAALPERTRLWPGLDLAADRLGHGRPRHVRSPRPAAPVRLSAGACPPDAVELHPLSPSSRPARAQVGTAQRLVEAPRPRAGRAAPRPRACTEPPAACPRCPSGRAREQSCSCSRRPPPHLRRSRRPGRSGREALPRGRTRMAADRSPPCRPSRRSRSRPRGMRAPAGCRPRRRGRDSARDRPAAACARRDGARGRPTGDAQARCARAPRAAARARGPAALASRAPSPSRRAGPRGCHSARRGRARRGRAAPARDQRRRARAR